MEPSGVPRVTSPLSAPNRASGKAGPVPTAEVSQRRELLLGELARRMLADLDSEGLARSAVEAIGGAMGLDLCALFSISGDILVARPPAIYRAQADAPSEPLSVGGASSVLECIRREGELVVRDMTSTGELAGPLARLARAVSARSLLVVPIMMGAQIRGVLVLASQRTTRDWQNEDRLLAREVSALMGTAQRQAGLLNEARHAGKREALLRQIGRALRSSLGLTHVLRTAAEQTGRAIGSDALTILRMDSNLLLAPLWTYRGDEGEATLSSTPQTRVAVSPKVVDELIATHAAVVTDRRWSASSLLGRSLGSEMLVVVAPIVVQGAVWGVIEITRRNPARRWREGELTLVSEITEQLATAIHQAELFDQMLRSKREWESTFDGMSDAVVIYDDARRVRRTNLAASEMLNRPLKSLVAEPCCSLGLCNGPSQCAVKRAFDTRERVTLEVFAPRTYHALLVTIDPIIDEKRKKLLGAVQVVRDMNDLRRTEAELKRRSEFLVNLIEAARDAIFVVDTAGRLVWSNSHLPPLTGFLVSEMLGRPHTVFVSPDAVTDVQLHFEAAAIGETRSFEVSVFNARTAEERRLVTTYSPIREDGKVVSVLGIAHDVTDERRSAERVQQADKLRALGQLASGVAHDVNNDLAAILGRVQRLMREPGYDQLRHDLVVVETAALDCAQTVRRIQNFARQQGDADFEAVNLNSLVRDAIEITRTRWLDDAQSRGLQYAVEFEAAELPPILGDGSQLREVFVNLIINALDAMPGGGALRITSKDQGGEAILKLADEGMGIPKSIRERVFEPFFTTKGAAGTGMGLAVSYGIITRHNGRIEVDSEPGQGTTFTIGLPLPKGTAMVIERPVRVVRLVSQLKVLVIDDEEVVREVLADLLEELGHTVVQVESGRKGIEHLERNAVDVVFTDLSMPEMDGWAVARVVRERHPDTKVVMVTGYGASAAQPVAKTDPVDAVIGKPFEYDDIAALLERLFTARTR
jgi:PAS domain S-box-containing protein